MNRLCSASALVVYLASALPSPAQAQRLDVGGLIGGFVGAAIQADQQRRAFEHQRQMEARERRARQAEAQRIRRDQQARLAEQKKAEQQRKLAEKTEQDRIKRLDKALPPARQLVEEASAFMQANPASPRLLEIAEQVATLNQVMAEGDPDKVEKRTMALSSDLQRDPAFGQFAQQKAEARRGQNARYLADALRLAASQRAFLVSFIAKNPASATAAILIPLVKQIDAAVAAPDLGKMQPLTERIDFAVRQAGLRNDFVAQTERAGAEPSGRPTPASGSAAPPVANAALLGQGLLAAPGSADRRSGPTPPETVASSSTGAPPAPARAAAEGMQLAVTDKNRFLIDGDLDDVIVLYNASTGAPHVVKNLRGDMVFEQNKADLCLYQAEADEALAGVARRALSSYGVRTAGLEAGPCDAARLQAYDVIVAKRSAFLRQPLAYSLSLVQELETDRYRSLAKLTAADLKRQGAAEAVTAAEIEGDVERGAKDGFGLALLTSGSPALCMVAAGEVEAHRRLLLGLADRLTADMGVQPVFAAASLEGAFVNIKRQQCGAVYAAAADLKSLIAALKRDAVAYRMSASWVAPTAVEAAAQAIAAEKAEAAQQALARQRRAEEERKLAALRAADQASTRAARQTALREQYGRLAAALAADIGNEVKLFTDAPDAAAARRAATKYPPFAAWFQDKLANRWELMSLNAELDDYGVSDWKGRSLDTAFARVNLRLKNRMLGDYEDACFLFAQISDSEFSVSREPAVAVCEQGDRVGDWKRSHQFQSRWFAE